MIGDDDDEDGTGVGAVVTVARMEVMKVVILTVMITMLVI